MLFTAAACLLAVDVAAAQGTGTAAAAAPSGTATEVKYKTEDGWTIYGTLRLPPRASAQRPVGAVVLLHEFGHDRIDFDRVLDIKGLGDVLQDAGLAVLSIDWRGRGQSMGKGQPVEDPLVRFAPSMRAAMYKDVTGALDFLAARPEVDRLRLGIVASEYSAEPAAKAVRESRHKVSGLALLSGLGLSAESREFLAEVEIPIFVSASVDDDEGHRAMQEVHARSRHQGRRFLSGDRGGRGYLFYLLEFLQEPGKNVPYRRDILAGWVTQQVKGLGRVRDVTFPTEDGWTITAELRVPDEAGVDGKKVAGVVVAPGARSDRYSMYAFSEELARRGVAVLHLEMRGRGASRGAALESAETRTLYREVDRARIERDVRGGLKFLAAQEGIDPNRLGLMGEAFGGKASLLAAAGDPRVKAIALLSPYGADDKEVQAYLSGTTPPIFIVDSEGNTHTRQRSELVHKLASNSSLVLTPGIGQGHHLTDYHRVVAPIVCQWLESNLR
jgi:dienelactone hydrolase